jgi:diadenosine tetraphosphate (Ap4A) HIT family hydrolase
MTDCIFCKIGSHEVENSEIFFEDEKVFAMLDQDWATKGHVLVVFKEHMLNMSDLSEKDFEHFSSVCKKIEAKLLKTLNLERGIMLKTGLIASHFHFHIYPVRKSISWPEVQDMFDKKVRYEPKPGEREELLAQLRTL